MKKITEERNKQSEDLDSYSVIDILKLINKEDAILHLAIAKQLSKIEIIINNVIKCFKNNGRLFYVGSGTSGRLGVLDASECSPTFKVDNNMVQGIIAGGKSALYRSIEGAEDSFEDGFSIIKEKNINSNDCVIGISASGSTDFVIGALNSSSSLGAYTVFLTFNKIKKEHYIDDLLEIIVGPEIVSGSTRMKSGTATKMILNMITTTSMVKSHKVYKNYMVDLRVTNKKLTNRAIRIIDDLTGLGKDKSQELLKAGKNNVKASLVMNHLSITYNEAILLLNKYNGNLRKILD
tara:strand:- start:177 stop:1055 length:879 start_codon:yes stop_codon:yes gene_type:complete